MRHLPAHGTLEEARRSRHSLCEMKDTYFDQNRLVDETTEDSQRTSSAWADTPDRARRRGALGSVAGAWSLERVLQDAEAIAEALGNDDEIRNLRRQRWWVQWRRPTG